MRRRGQMDARLLTLFSAQRVKNTNAVEARKLIPLSDETRWEARVGAGVDGCGNHDLKRQNGRGERCALLKRNKNKEKAHAKQSHTNESKETQYEGSPSSVR